MSSFFALSTQLFQFFLMLIIGCCAAKAGIIRREALVDLSRLVTRLLLPMSAFYSIFYGNHQEQFAEGLPVLLFTGLFYLTLCGIFALLAKRLRLQKARCRVYQALFIFGNTGFVGMPLLQNLYPGKGMVYMALFTVIDQLLLWTYGLWLTDGGRQRFSLRNFANPNIIAIVLAVTLVLMNVSMPHVLLSTVQVMGQASTAVCMVYLGAMFFYSDWKPALRKKEVYLGIVVKMICVPLIVWVLLSALHVSRAMLESLVILSALPTMTVIPMLAQNSGEGEYAIGAALMTLAACLLTIPIVFLIMVTWL